MLSSNRVLVACLFGVALLAACAADSGHATTFGTVNGTGGSTGPTGGAVASVASGGASGSSMGTSGTSPNPAGGAGMMTAGRGGSPNANPAGASGASGMRGTMMTTAGSTSTSAAGTTGGSAGSSPPPAGADEVCARWKADRANLAEGTWSGDVASCNAGDISQDGRDNALRLVNLYRWLAKLDPITMDDGFNKKAQACALMLKANNMLSHMPPSSWKCYTADGAEAAGKCNISSGPGVSSVDGYMIDPGNPTTIGHRRWILSNQIGPTGFGSTDRYSCLWTFGTMHPAKGPWTAWPPAGVIPKAALGMGFQGSADTTGWTIQSDSVNFANATVTITVNGTMQPVTVNQLGSGYGSRYAINFIPMGWKSESGKTYTVTIGGIASPITYDVQFVDCP